VLQQVSVRKDLERSFSLHRQLSAFHPRRSVSERKRQRSISRLQRGQSPERLGEPVRHAFHRAFVQLSNRINFMLALPIESLERQALIAKLRTIGTEASQ
jgi:hypothetical protein